MVWNSDRACSVGVHCCCTLVQWKWLVWIQIPNQSSASNSFTSSESMLLQTCRASLLLRVPDSWSKDCQFKFWQEQQENALLQSSIFVPTLYLLFVPSPCYRSGQSFCQKCRWQVTPKHTYTLDPAKSEWTYLETSSHTMCQETFDHSHLSSLSHCGLILV